MSKLTLAIRLLFLVMLLSLTACANRQVAQVSPQQYIVKRGDTLSSIAWRFQLDYRTLAQWNRVGEPYTIHPGQRLFLSPPPGSRSQVVTRGPVSPPSVSTSPRRPVLPPPARVPAPSPEAAIAWRWPTQGRVVKPFSSAGSGGVDIRGVEGQPVLASASGSVVYSGTGLKGYGELIIIRHSQTWLSAYAHNRSRYVKEGDVVSAGQKIAELGKNNKGEPILHFEIRKFGKPVDPMVFLAKNVR